MTINPKTAPGPEPKSANVGQAPPLDSMVLFEKTAMEQWLRGMTEVSQEIAAFTQTRLQEDAAAWIKLWGCRTPNDSLECQQRFLERAMEQYQTEIARLAQIVGRAGKDTHGKA